MMKNISLSQLFRNDHVRICDLRVMPTGTFEITHKNPVIRINTNIGSCILSENKSAMKSVCMKKNEVYALPKGTDWSVTNAGSTEFRQIIIEFLGNAKYAEEDAQQVFSKAVHTSERSGKLIENERARVYELLYPANSTANPVIHHTVDHFYIFIGDHSHSLSGDDVEGNPLFNHTLRDGDVIYAPVENGGFDADGTPTKKACYSLRNSNPNFALVGYFVEIK